VSSLALRLLLARGLRLGSTKSCARLPGIAKLMLVEDCGILRLRAARQLAWGLCLDDCYPVLSSVQGKRVGLARVLLQEMCIPLEKAAPHVANFHVGGCERTGWRQTRGQSLEVTEQKVLRTVTSKEIPISFDASRSPVDDTGAAGCEDLAAAWENTLSLLGCSMLRLDATGGS